jgi:ABC-type transporter lipoprotein component MlaA/uncharacterized glyoxalase superfamily protein PhnB
MFRMCGRDDDQAPAAVKFMKEALGAKTIFIVDDKTTYSQGLADGVEKNCVKSGLKVLGRDHVNQGDKDFSAILTMAKKHNADVFYMSLQNHASGSLMAIQAKRMGLKSKIVSQDAMFHPNFIKVAKDTAEGIFVTYGYTDESTPAYQAYEKRFTSSYGEIVPEDIRQAADNFCYNLQEPIRFVNALLQLRFSDAGTVLTRFAVNTVGGVAGLGDVAGREFGFKRVDAGLGETLQYWGVKDGFYLVMPLRGATTLRELFGTTVDGMAMTPYYFLADSWQESSLIYMGRRVNNLSLNLDYYEGLKKMPTIDPYKALRDSYFQYRDQARQRNTRPSPNDKL